MPTGYTHDVQSGEITEFRDFALSCARAFGALVTMRDAPDSAPIPDNLEPNTKYHDDEIARNEAILAEITGLSDAKCDARARKQFDKELKCHNERQQERRQHKMRYETMLKKVNKWSAPADHMKLKEFMKQQLTESINYDCSDYYDSTPVRLTGEEWRREQLENAASSLEYHRDEREKEIKRTDANNKWLRQLRDSLK